LSSLQKSSLELAELIEDEEDDDEDEEEDDDDDDEEVCGQSHMISNRHTPVGKSQTSSLQTSFGALGALIRPLIFPLALLVLLSWRKKKKLSNPQHNTSQPNTIDRIRAIRSRKMDPRREEADEEAWKQLRIVSRFVQEASMNVSVMVDLVEEQIPFLLALHRVSADLANSSPLPQRGPRSQSKSAYQPIEE